MELEILKTVGQVAGIGGIALGVLLLVFRDVVRQQIFPQLTKEQAYRLLTTIIVLVWSVAVLGVGAWVWTASPRDARSGGIQRVNTGIIIMDKANITDSDISVIGGTESSDDVVQTDAAR